jgi:hypothetical protein
VIARVRLDWMDPAHFEPRAATCRVCATPTHMRDGQGRPCHQSCAETELAAEIVAARGAVIADERRPKAVRDAR